MNSIPDIIALIFDLLAAVKEMAKAQGLKDEDLDKLVAEAQERRRKMVSEHVAEEIAAMPKPEK